MVDGKKIRAVLEFSNRSRDCVTADVLLEINSRQLLLRSNPCLTLELLMVAQDIFGCDITQKQELNLNS